MSQERRYDEEEVAEILRSAASAEGGSPLSAVGQRGAGMSLAELREIGTEVGIPTDRIDQAAMALESPIPVSRPRFLGAPRFVARTAPIERPLSDEEWTRLVALLRETFAAHGNVETHGTLRSWSNGNLQVHVEPADSGYRVRMQTFKGNITEFAIMATAFLGMAVFMGAAILLKRGLDPALMFPAAFGLAGLGVLARARLALPRWADRRAAQMEAIADRLPRIMGSGGQ